MASMGAWGRLAQQTLPPWAALRSSSFGQWRPKWYPWRKVTQHRSSETVHTYIIYIYTYLFGCCMKQLQLNSHDKTAVFKLFKLLKVWWVHGGFLSHRGTPSYRWFRDGIFHCEQSSYWGFLYTDFRKLPYHQWSQVSPHMGCTPPFSHFRRGNNDQPLDVWWP